MRSLSMIVTTLALVIGAGCHKNDTDKAADKVESAQKDVNKQEKDVRAEQNKTAEARRDLNQQQRELDHAQANLNDAKQQYQATINDRLTRIDQKLNDLAARTDAKAKSDYASLKARRDDMNTRISGMSTTASDRWDSYKKDTNDSLDKLESDIDGALKHDDKVDRTNVPTDHNGNPKKY